MECNENQCYTLWHMIGDDVDPYFINVTWCNCVKQFFFNMCCHTGITESYESIQEWDQDIEFPDFDQNNEGEKVPRKTDLFSRGKFC